MIETSIPCEEMSGTSHNGRELELMLAGSKPFAIFEEAIVANSTSSQFDKFDDYVRNGRIVRQITEDRWGRPRRVEGQTILGTRKRFYALPTESWRIQAYLHLKDAVEGQIWNEALETFVCRLLGYSRAEAVAWTDSVKRKYGGWGGVPAFLPLTDVDLREIQALGLKAIPPTLEGPRILIFQEEVPDSKLLCSTVNPNISAIARIGIAGSFYLSLKVEEVEGRYVLRFDKSLIPEINRNLRRDIEIFPSALARSID